MAVSRHEPGRVSEILRRPVQPYNESTIGLPAYRALLSAIICRGARSAGASWQPYHGSVITPLITDGLHHEMVFTATNLSVKVRYIGDEALEAGLLPETRSKFRALRATN